VKLEAIVSDYWYPWWGELRFL